MATRAFDGKSFAIRWLVAVALVLGTVNPTGYSYYHWVGDFESGNAPLKVLAGVALLILYVIYLRATWRSIGPIGIVLALAFFGALIWSLAYYGLLDTSQTTVMTYIALLLIATVMAVGISWSHVRRRVSGQADMDDVDE